jgi:Cu+-exporting ATPase
VIGLSLERKLLGRFALGDVPKPQAAEAIARLRRARHEVFLITGDSPATAAAIATQVGISGQNVFAGIRPEHKAQIVADLQDRGLRVAFVGDGINDAPALEQADLGIAVSRASDVAREAADLVLLRSDIEAIPEAIGLAQAALRTIRQNLFWAFFYNAAAIPLAALGFLSPVICAAAMGLSDVLVIGNALRLCNWRPRR